MSNPLFDPERYQAVRKPLLEAATLPPACYTSTEFFEREIERVFLRNWQFVGREEQLEAPGDYFCYEGPGGSVIIMRTAERQLKAYANSCRHRGSRLLTGAGSCKRIVCPYHSWSYRLDGNLSNTPGMQQTRNFDPAEYALLELPLATWDGFVFIHYGSPLASLTSYLGDMPDRFASHRCADMHHVGSMDFDINANWKLLAENALEAYHTGTVHRATLGQQQASAIESDGNWTGLLVEDERSVATLPGATKPFPHIDGLDGGARRGAFFTMVFPSTQLVFAQDCMWWLAFHPVSADHSRLTLGACFPQSTIDLAGFDDRVKSYFERWRVATAEDNAICEAQQDGQKLARAPGRFAASEFAVHALANWVLDQVLDS
jgi:phenylpropionate dioxygenase-like ring-hydroxylating dioxygenase large terminal subunit